MKIFIICTCLIGLSVAEIPPEAPYAPSGWKPQGAQLTLPSRQYGAPEQSRIVDISKQRVQFAGQLQQETVNNAYLPPAPVDNQVLTVQGLPTYNAPNQFNGQLNTGEIVPLQVIQPEQNYRVNIQRIRQQPIRQQPQQLGQFRQQPQQLRPQPQKFRQQPQQFSPAGQQQSQQTRQPLPQFNQQFAQSQRQQVAGTPQEQYGAPPPTQQYGTPAEQPEEQNFETNAEEEETEEVQGPSVAVANAVSNGQYYILGADNTLQRVIYMTSQTEDDKVSNGFTAQLKYAPVEPIRDPIYAYDAEGQLVRIYNK